MQMRRIVIMMIIEYVVPSLALNYPCKKYQIIYESVHIYLCTCMGNQIPMQKWICITYPHTSCVEVDQFLNSQHAWACWDTDRQSNVHFLWPNELTICPDINGFQIPLKTSCTEHRWRKAKDVFVFCSGKICLVLFQGCCYFDLPHLCPVHKVNAQTTITTILATHLLH